MAWYDGYWDKLAEKFANLKQWFGILQNGLTTANVAFKKAWEYIQNRLVIFLIPVAIALKSAWDFISTMADLVLAELEKVSLNSITEDGLLQDSSFLENMEFMNTILPLTEIFGWAVFLIMLWGVCLLIRTLKGIKQTISF